MQKSNQWKAERLGVITSTKAHMLLSSNKTRENLMCQMIAEIASGQWKDINPTKAMTRGSEIEDEAVAYFEMMYDCEVHGADDYITHSNPYLACSPDGLIGFLSGLEIKRLDEHNHIRVMMYEKIEPKYFSQIEWCMYVTGRPYWSYFGYCETLPEPLTGYLKDFEMSRERRNEIDLIANKFTQELDGHLDKFGLKL